MDDLEDLGQRNTATTYRHSRHQEPQLGVTVNLCERIIVGTLFDEVRRGSYLRYSRFGFAYVIHNVMKWRMNPCLETFGEADCTLSSNESESVSMYERT